MAKPISTICGMSVSKTKDGVYEIDKKTYNKFLEEKGITPDVVKKINEVQNEVIIDATKYLSAQIAEDKSTDKKVVNVPDPINKISVSMYGSRELLNPSTQKKMTVYGQTTVRLSKSLVKPIREAISVEQEMLKSIFDN